MTNESDRQSPAKRGLLSLYNSTVTESNPTIESAHQTDTCARVFSMVSDIKIPATRGMTSLIEGQSESFT